MTQGAEAHPGTELQQPRPRAVGWIDWGALKQRAFPMTVVVVLLWIVGAPITFLILSSVRSGTPVAPGPFTLANFAAVYTSPLTYPALLNTVVYASVVSFLSLVIATLFAWLIERTDMPGRDWAWTMMLLPIAMPGMLASMAWILLLSPKVGLLNLPLRAMLSTVGIELETGPLNIYSLPGMIFIESIRGTTSLFLMIVGAFRVMDPAFEEAAQTSGGGRLRVFRHITLGLMRPALLAAGMYAFLSNLEDFDTPLLIGLQAGVYLLPTLIYFSAFSSSRAQYGLAAAYASIFLIITIILVWVYYRLILRSTNRFAVVTGKGFRPRRQTLGRWRYAAFALFIVYFLLSVALPVLVLVWASLLRGYQAPTPEILGKLTLENFVTIWNDRTLLGAIGNTTVLATVTATVTVTFSFVVSWIVVRKRVWGSAVVDAFAFIPHAVPSIAIGTALIILYLNPAVRWIPIYGTLWIMVLALMTRYLAFATRTSNAAITGVSRDLEEAAHANGVNRLTTIVRVTIPLLFPTFIASWIWVASHSFRNLTIPLMLSAPGTQTVASVLYDYWERKGDFSLASALGVLLLLAMGAAVFLARRLMARGYA